MNIYYTARGTFDKEGDADGLSWEKYLQWSRLTQLKELVSVDCMLNEDLVEPDRNNAEDWKYIVTDEGYETGFFTSLEYVLRKMQARATFNLLAVAIEPAQDCKNKRVDGFEFAGYDLLDREYGNSALTNCGGFDETFLPAELNHFGLIDAYGKAKDIKKGLSENNPDEHHAHTNVIAVWRHKTTGRKKAGPPTEGD